MAKCPRCGTDVPELTREWDYSGFHVKRYDCKKCEKSFRVYFHKGKVSHVIMNPRKPKIVTKKRV